MNIRWQKLYPIMLLAISFAASACTSGTAEFTADTTAAETMTHTISGVVSGTTASGVSLALAGDMIGTTATNSLGAYFFSDVPDGSYTVTPSLTNYKFTPLSSSVTVSGADVANVDFSDVGDFELSGMVSGSAIQSVSIALTGATNSVTTTDASGYFRFFGLDSGSYTVSLGLGGYAFVPASRGILISSASVTNLVFASIPNGGPFYTISGSVSGATSTGVTVYASGPSCASAATDANGNYTITGLPSGNYAIEAWKECYSASPIAYAKTITTSNLASVGFTMTAKTCSPGGMGVVPSGSMSGTVSGAVQQGVTMVLTGYYCQITTTDINGYYYFTYPSGNYTVTPALVGHTFSPVSRRTTGGNVTGFDFTAL